MINRFNFSVLVFLLFTSCSINGAKNERKNVDIFVEIDNGELRFTITNKLSQIITISRDFTHYQNMHLVLVTERNRRVVDRGIVPSDPDIGYYQIESDNIVVESVDLREVFPYLSEYKGSAVIFWRTDVDVCLERTNCSDMVFHGSIKANF